MENNYIKRQKNKNKMQRSHEQRSFEISSLYSN